MQTTQSYAPPATAARRRMLPCARRHRWGAHLGILPEGHHDSSRRSSLGTLVLAVWEVGSDAGSDIKCCAVPRVQVDQPAWLVQNGVERSCSGPCHHQRVLGTLQGCCPFLPPPHSRPRPQPPRPTSRHRSACSGRALVSAMSDWFCAQAAFFKNYAAGMNTFELSMDLLYFSAAHHHIATRYNPRLRMIHTRAHGRALVCVPGLLK